MITYRALTGDQVTGEIWAPGPNPGTVWVLDPTAPHGARVVHVRYAREQEYGVPTVPGPRTVTRADYYRALGINHAQRQHDDWRSYRTSWSTPDIGIRPEPPAAADRDWAAETIARWDTEQWAADFYRAAHFATASVAARTFKKLVWADALVLDTDTADTAAA